MEYHLCRMCEKKYEEKPTDKLSNQLGHYLKAYMGFCDIKCWNKLTLPQKAHEKLILGVHGTTRKDNHFKY